MADLVFVVVMGLVVGSFIELVAYRVPRGQSIIWPRSQCVHCRHVLSALDLIPIISWAILRGRCRYCSAPIGWRAPLIEFGCVAIGVWAWGLAGSWHLLETCIMGWMLFLLSIIDIICFMLPDMLIFILAAVGVASAASQSTDALRNGLLGAGVGFMFFLLVAFLYRKYRDRQGLGFGDVKLLAALGAWVSWQGLPSVIFLSSLLGLIFVSVVKVSGRRVSFVSALPFGPFLAVAGWLVWLYGPLQGQ